MKISNLGFCEFTDAFLHAGRESSFSYHGKKALYEYLNELEESLGEEIELDVIALDCDFVEYDSLDEIKKEYSDIETIEDLYDNTSVIECENGAIIIQAY